MRGLVVVVLDLGPGAVGIAVHEVAAIGCGVRVPDVLPVLRTLGEAVLKSGVAEMIGEG